MLCASATQPCCTSCHKGQGEVSRLISLDHLNDIFICNECVNLCMTIVCETEGEETVVITRNEYKRLLDRDHKLSRLNSSMRYIRDTVEVLDKELASL